MENTMRFFPTIASRKRPSANDDASGGGVGLWGAAGLLTLAVMLAYAGSLGGAWVYDDVPAIVENPTLRSLGTAWFPPVASGSPVSGRPVVNVSLALNYALTGLRPWSYHLTNALIHVAAMLVLFGLVRRTTRLRSSAASDATWLAFSASGGWALHPLQTEAVTYVVQRAESLMGLFFLVTLYAYLRAATAERPLKWLVVSVAACACGMGTKEVMIAAPFVVLLYDWTFLRAHPRVHARPRWRWQAALGATGLILLGLAWSAGSRGGTAGFSTTTTVWSYFTVQLRAHLLYLKLAAWPHPLVFDYGVDDLPFALPLSVLLSLAVLVFAAVVLAVRRRMVLGFLAGTYLLILAPTSSVLPIVTEPVAEHRLYLPLACLVVAGVGTVTCCLGGRGRWLLVAVALALALATAHRQQAYVSERALWTDTVAKWPRNARAQYNLGRVLSEHGDFAAAVAHDEAALALRPDFASGHSNLANALLQLGRVAEAATQASEAVRLNPALPEAHNNLGNALLLRRDLTRAVEEYRRALQLDPDNVDIRNNLGTAYSELGRLDEARREYAAALRAKPDSALLHFNLANTLARMGRFDAAIVEYQSTLRVDPHYPRANENLARVKLLQSAR
jgi:Flp pilus assembly protein TadD